MLIKTIDDVHNCCLETLQAFDSFCKSHNIEYYIAFGTLLGAVRDGDFIPWDDDIDVVLKRDQYNKLLSIPKSEYPEGFIIETPCQNGIFYDFIPQFINLKHEGIRINAEDYYTYSDSKFNPGMDLFILDECSPGLRHKFQILRMRTYYLLARGHRQFKKNYSTGGKHHYLLNTLANVLGFIGKHMNLDKIYRKYEQTSSKYAGSQNYFPSNVILSELTTVYSKELFEKSVFVKIRGVSFPSPADYNTYLTIEYGDYMSPPPEQNRAPYHYKLES